MTVKEAKTKYGTFLGLTMEGYTLFKGIPYAKPPIGKLRFEPPQKPSPHKGIKRADTFANRALQREQNEGFYGKEFYSLSEYMPSCSEDCLYLNIWTPAASSSEKLPVAVWIHGGAFSAGYGSEMEFDGKAYAKKGVILVTINYRLGVFGFLAHPALSAASKYHVSGNYGILDQIAALKWVKENIAAFGGNPDNITLFGQSAGGMSVQTICSSPLGKGLITKAIIQSAGGYQSILLSDYPLKEAEAYGEMLADRAGCKNLDDLKKVPAKKLLSVAEEMMKEAFLNIKKGGLPPKVSLPLSPVIDGHVLIKGYNQAIKEGFIAPIPYIIGSTANDIGEGMPGCENFPDDGEGPLYHAAKNFSLQLEKKGQAPAWCYSFRRKMPGDKAGAFHSAELWYIFGTYERCWRPLTEKDAALSEKMVTFWTNFMKCSNPNAPNHEEWKPCRQKEPFVYSFDIE